MKAAQLKPGQILDTYYGDGSFKYKIKITRITDKSIFHTTLDGKTEFRDAITSVDRYLNKNLWKYLEVTKS